MRSDVNDFANYYLAAQHCVSLDMDSLLSILTLEEFA